MAQIPKCKHCKQEVLDKSQATKKGSYWYHNSCLEEMERVKKKYKPKEGSDRRICTDEVQRYMEYSGIETNNNSLWQIVQKQLNKLLENNQDYNYRSIAYTLWYCREILELQMNRDTLIIGLVEWNYEKAKQYCEEMIKLKKEIDEFTFEDKEVVIKKSFSNKKKRKMLTFD